MEKPHPVLSLDEFVSQIKSDLKITEFLVFNADAGNSYIELDVSYKAEFFCLMLVNQGQAEYTANENAFVCSAGDVVFSPSMETFSVTRFSEDFQAVYLLFSTQFLLEAGFNYKSYDILKALSSTREMIVRGNARLFSRLLFHVRELDYLNSSLALAYYYNEMIWHHFSLVVYELDIHIREKSGAQRLTSREEELTTRFFALVRENYHEHHDVQFYADRLFITRKYLSRVVKKTMDKSPRDIISKVLVIESKVLLKKYSLNIGDVSGRLKFADSAVFSKFFKKHTGQTPTEYKNQDFF